jgi:hypothetical protein
MDKKNMKSKRSPIVPPSPFSGTSPAQIRVRQEVIQVDDKGKAKEEVADTLANLKYADPAGLYPIQKLQQDKDAVQRAIDITKDTAKDAAITGAITQGKAPSPVRSALRTLNHLIHTHWVSSKNPVDEWEYESESLSGWTDDSELVNQWPTPPSTPPTGNEDKPPSWGICGEHPGPGWELNDPLTRNFYKFLIPDPYTGHSVVAPFIQFNCSRQNPTCRGSYGRGFPTYTRSVIPTPVDYHCAPLLPHQICILDAKAPFAHAVNKVINEYFPLDLAASIRQYQYFKDTQYSIQAVRQQLFNKETNYQDHANDTLTYLENANVLGRLMAHLDIIHEELLGDKGTGHAHFSHAVRGFTQPITHSATDTRINPFLSPQDPRKNAYQESVGTSALAFPPRVTHVSLHFPGGNSMPNDLVP